MEYNKNLIADIYIQADKEQKNLHILKVNFNDVSCTPVRGKNFLKKLLEKYNVLEIMENNKEAFPFKEDGGNSENYQVYSILNKSYDKNVWPFNKEPEEDILYRGFYSSFNAAFFKFLSENYNGKFSFSKYSWWDSTFRFYLDEDKNAEKNLERYIFDFLNDISFDYDFIRFEIEKETIKPNKNEAFDLVGNEIKIGDIGVGNAGRGKNASGLTVEQVLTIGKTYINSNISPNNFLVLKPIDGREIKGV